jgi:hypothetical protein
MCRQTDPVLLALPRRTNSEPPAREQSGAPELDRLHLIETACGPKAEVDLLVELLTRTPGLAQSLADPNEVHNYHNPLASVNAYKHRMHALRCEYVNARLRALDLEEQLSEARARIERLQNHIQFLDATLQAMRTSRAWKAAEKCSRWSRAVARWLRRLPHAAKSKAIEPTP